MADAYWRAGRPDELIEIVRYAISVGSIPMLMTHGQTLIEQPEFLERLVVEGGLRQISVHVDMTQAGRHGYPDRPDQMRSGSASRCARRSPISPCAVRAKTGLAAGVRAQFHRHPPEHRRRAGSDALVSGRPGAHSHLAHAQLSTGSRHGPDDFLASARSRPPTSGRKSARGSVCRCAATFRFSAIRIAIAGLRCWWRGLPGKSFRSCRTIRNSIALLGEVLRKIGGLSLVNDDAGTPAFRLLGVLFSIRCWPPKRFAQLVRYMTSRNAPPEILPSLLRGQVHTVGVGMHNFMDAAQVANAPNDPVMQARLDSCVFKGAVKRTANGWPCRCVR